MEIERASLMRAYNAAPVEGAFGAFGVDDAIAIATLAANLLGNSGDAKKKRMAEANALVKAFGMDYVSGAAAANLDVNLVQSHLVSTLANAGVNISAEKVRALAVTKTSSASAVVTNYLPWFAIAGVAAFILMRR